mmetsp:Transcript_13988/g.33040  ORF Transcript_13988/g.33040 Transcript_13988/m.33040 type:complete len:282 (+) Transcript_13988:667-1512(+)
MEAVAEQMTQHQAKRRQQTPEQGHCPEDCMIAGLVKLPGGMQLRPESKRHKRLVDGDTGKEDPKVARVFLHTDHDAFQARVELDGNEEGQDRERFHHERLEAPRLSLGSLRKLSLAQIMTVDAHRYLPWRGLFQILLLAVHRRRVRIGKAVLRVVRDVVEDQGCVEADHAEKVVELVAHPRKEHGFNCVRDHVANAEAENQACRQAVPKRKHDRRSLGAHVLVRRDGKRHPKQRDHQQRDGGNQHHPPEHLSSLRLLCVFMLVITGSEGAVRINLTRRNQR